MAQVGGVPRHPAKSWLFWSSDPQRSRGIATQIEAELVKALKKAKIPLK